ncbi:filamentous hemagglutinin family protein [Humitalea rosea]|uniref:Filamentous hemagglutinin family protein n=1 Tax=Humitalea rosea TaxID=990373 RepID=A0A2W7IW83_9PROT|nr:filamentous hemagglutinin N-terminal domain-containing protein [Humitalea rosea]PZW51018.1 filamentous hemagglutinin family protein [Humitalea rosea]
MAQSDLCRTRVWLLGSTALLPIAIAPALGQSIAPNTAPTGGIVVSGQAAISQNPTTTTIQQGSNRAAIDWQSFNVGSNQAVQFQQPNAASWTLNRVNAPDPSVIAGRITANGGIAIVNQSGVVFTGTAQVNIASLIASTANITNENFMGGRMVFDQPGRPGARIENQGSITVAERGIAALVAPGVSNSGTIHARLGRVALQGAEAFALDLAGDGLLSIDVTQAVRTAPNGAQALVTNSGTIDAAGGSILISAHAASGLVEDLVRHTGRASAETVDGRTGQVAIRAEGGGVRVGGTVTATGGAGQRGGSVELRGSTTTSLDATARVDVSGGTGGGRVNIGTTGVGRNQRMGSRTRVARGAVVRADATVAGTGGTIAVNAATTTEAEGIFSARGGPSGGDGGFVELSGQKGMTLDAIVDVTAPQGRGGTLLLDPDSIEVVATGGGAVPVDQPGLRVVAATDGVAGVTQVDAALVSAAGVATVRLEATNDITFSAPVARDGDLQLFAGGNIAQAAGAIISADTLTIRGTGGTGGATLVNLPELNRIGSLDAIATKGLTFNNGSTLDVLRAVAPVVTLATTAGNLTLSGPVGQAGASVDLTGFIDLTQTAGGLVTAGTLVVKAFGLIDLPEANDVQRFRNQGSLPSSLTFASTRDLVLGRVQAASDGSITLTAPSLAVGIVDGTSSLFAESIALTATAGSITQILGVALLNASGSTALRASATADLLLPNSGNDIGTLFAEAGGTLNVATSGAMMVTRASATSIALSAGTGLTVQDSGAGGLGVQAFGAIALDASSLVIGSVTGTNGNTAIRSTGGGTLSLRGDALDLGGLVTTAGTLEIGPHTAGSAVTIGAAGGLQIDPAQIEANVEATTLRIGETTIGTPVTSGSVTVAAAFQPSATAVAGRIELVSGGAIAVNAALGRAAAPGDVLLASATTIDIAAPVTAAILSLHANGAIAQTVAGSLTATSLLTRGLSGGATRAGSVDFTAASATNAVSRLSLNSTGAASYTQSGAFFLDGADVGAALTLRALAGGIDATGTIAAQTLRVEATGLTQSGGTITADRLTALTTGAIALGQANAIAAIRAETTALGGTIAITTTGTTEVAADAIASVGFTAGALVVGTVDGLAGIAAPGITLTTTAGTLTQTQALTGLAPTGTTALTIATAAGAVLEDAANRIGSVTGSSGGSLSVHSSTALTALALAAGGIGNPQAIGLQGPSLLISGPQIAASIGLEATTGTITQSATGVLSAPGGATVLTTVSAGATTLTQAGNLIADATVTAGSLPARAAVALRSDAGLTVRTGPAGVAGVSDLTIDAPDVVLDGVRTAAGLNVTSGSAITQTAAVSVAGSMDLAAAAQILLDRGDNAFSSLGRIAAGRAATSDAQNRLVLRTAAAGLLLNDDVTLGLTAGGLTARSGGRIELVADGIAYNKGLISTPGGTVNLAPATDGRHVALARVGGIDDVTAYDGTQELALSAALLGAVRADTLVVGEAPSAAGIRAGSIRQYSGDIDLSSAGAPGLLTLAARGFIRQRGFSGTVADEAAGTGGAGGAGGTRGGLTVTALSATSDTGDIWLGADNASLSVRGMTAAGPIVLRLAPGQALDVTGTIRAGTGAVPSRVTLVADTMTASGAALVSAPGGDIELLPVTAGRGVTLGDAGTPAGLVISSTLAAALGDAGDASARVIIGRSTDSAVTGNALWATDFSLGRQEAFLGDTGAAASGPRTAGDILLGTGADFTGRVGRLELFAGVEGTATGRISQSTGTLIVSTLSGESRKGSVIDSASVATLAGFRAGTAATALGEADFGLGNGAAALTVSGTLSVGLRGDASIASRLGRIELAAGSLDLAADLTAPAALGSALAAGSATSQVVLRASAGAITQSAGSIAAGRLAALAPNGAVTLGGTGNLIRGLAAVGATSPLLGAAMGGDAATALLAGGDIVFTTTLATGLATEADRALLVTGAIRATGGAAGTVIADADAIETAGARAGDAIVTGAGRSVTLTADDLDLQAAVSTNGGTLRIARLDTGVADVVLGSRATADEVGLFLSAAELAQINTLGALPGLAPAGTALPGRTLLVSTGSIRVNEAVTLPDAGELRLQAAGDLSQTNGAAIGARALSGSIGGQVALAAADNDIAVVRDLFAGGDIALRLGRAGGALVQGYDASTGAASGSAAPRITGTSAGFGLRSGGTITVAADDLDLRAEIGTEGSAIALRPILAGQALSIGRIPEPAAGSALSLTPLELGHLAFYAPASKFGTPVTGGTTLTLGSDTAGMLRLGRFTPNAETLVLRSGVGIEQSDAIAGDRTAALTVTNLDAQVTTAGTAAIWLGADNKIGSVSARVLGAVPGSSLTLAQAAGRTLTVGTNGLAVPVGGRITLVADTLALNGTVSAPSGAAADALSLGGTFGTVEIAPRTRGRAVALGGAQASSLLIDAGILARIDTSNAGGPGLGLLRIGASDDQVIAGNGTGLAAIGGSQTVLGAGPVTAGAITIVAATDVTGAARQLELYAGAQGDAARSAISQAGALTVTRLAGAATGDILLPLAANQIQVLAPRFGLGTGASLTAGAGIGQDEDVVLRLASGVPLLSVTGQVSVGGETSVAVDAGVVRRLELRAADLELGAGLMASRGTVLLAPLAEDGTAPILLGATGTGFALTTAEIAQVDTRHSGGGAGTLQIGLAGATPGTGTGAITLGGDVAVSDATSARVAELRLETGIAADGTRQAVTQAAGTLSTPTLSGSIAGGVSLTALGNRISRITDLATGGDTAIAVGLADASGVPLLDARFMPVGGAGPLRLDRGPGGFALAMAGGGTLALTADGLAIEAGAGTLRAPGGTVLLRPRSDGRAILLGGGLDTAGLALDTAELAAMGEAASPIALLRIGADTAGAITVLGDAGLRDAATDATSAIPGERVQRLELRSGAGISQTGGRIMVGDFAASGTSIALDGSNQIDRVVGRTADGAPGTSLAEGLLATGGVSLTSTRALTLAADLQAGGDLAIIASGAGADLTLAAAQSAASAGGNATLRSTDADLLIAGSLTALNTATAAADLGSATLTGSIAGTAVELLAGTDAVVTGGSLTGASATIQAGQDARLDAGAGVTGASVVVDAGRDAIAGAATISSSGGLSLAADRDVVLAGASTLSAATGLDVTAGRDLASSGSLATSGGTATLTGTGSLTQHAGLIAAPVLVLNGGTIAQAAAGADIQAPRLSVAATGAVTLGALGGHANGISELASFTAGGASTLRSAGDLIVTGPVTGGGGLVIRADGAMTLPDGVAVTGATGAVALDAGGAMTLGAATVQALAGDASLTSGGAGRFAGARIAARDSLTVSAAASLAFTDVVLDAGTVLAAAGQDLAGTRLTGTTSGGFRLSAGGSVGLTASAFTADVFEALAGGALALDGVQMTLGNSGLLSGASFSGSRVTATAPGLLRVQSAGGLDLSDSTLVAGTLQLAAGGAETLTRDRFTTTALDAAAGGDLTVDTVTAGGRTARFAAGGSGTFRTASLTASEALTIAATAGLTLTDTGLDAGAAAISAGQDLAGTRLTATTTSGFRLGAGGGLGLAASTITAAGFEAVSGGGLALDGVRLTLGSSGLVSSGAGFTGTQLVATSGGGLRIASAGDFGLVGSSLAAGTLQLAAGGAQTLTGTTLSSTTLDATSGAAMAYDTVTSNGGDARFAAGGAGEFRNASLSAAKTLSISAAGGLTFTDVTLDPITVTLDAGQALTATRLTGIATGTFGLSAGGAITLTDSRFTADVVQALAGGNLTVNGVTFTLGTSAVLSGQTTSIEALTARAGGVFRMTARDTLRLGNSRFTADVVEAVAGSPGAVGSTITLDAPVSMALGTGAFLAAGGGIYMPGLLTITPQQVTRLPVLVTETRQRADAYTALPTTAVPDVPGRRPQEQGTQVATRTSPSAFTPVADVRPAGEVVLNVAAGDSAIFLLIDGGKSSGTIDAGRLGIHGGSGAAEFTGNLGGLEGGLSATRGDVSRFLTTGLFTPGSQQFYRFNACVIGATACNTLAVLQPLPVVLTSIPDLRLAPTPRDPDALLPNIAEEDY